MALCRDPEWAVNDFLRRIQNSESIYESVKEAEYSYIKDINVGETIVANQIKGYLPTRIVYYLMNLHIMPRRIYLSAVISSFILLAIDWRTDAHFIRMANR